jgi:hypothetical protein
MAATYDPTSRALLVYDGLLDGPPTGALASEGAPLEARVVSPIGRVWVDARTLSLDVAVPRLARLRPSAFAALSASEQVYARASRLALSLVAQGRVMPSVVEENGVVCARHRATLDDDAVRGDVDALVRAMPPAAHAAPATSEGALVVWGARDVLTAFLDAAVDALIRVAARSGPLALPDAALRDRLPTWNVRAVDALVGDDARVWLAAGDAEENAAALIERATAGAEFPSEPTVKAPAKTSKKATTTKKRAHTASALAGKKSGTRTATGTP